MVRFKAWRKRQLKLKSDGWQHVLKGVHRLGNGFANLNACVASESLPYPPVMTQGTGAWVVGQLLCFCTSIVSSSLLWLYLSGKAHGKEQCLPLLSQEVTPHCTMGCFHGFSVAYPRGYQLNDTKLA